MVTQRKFASSSENALRFDTFFDFSKFSNFLKNVEAVDKIVAADEAWRKTQFTLERTKFVKNLCSKTIGQKMKAKE